MVSLPDFHCQCEIYKLFSAAVSPIGYSSFLWIYYHFTVFSIISVEFRERIERILNNFK